MTIPDCSKKSLLRCRSINLMIVDSDRQGESRLELFKESSRRLFLGLIGLTLVCIAAVALAPTDADKTVYSDVISILASGSALAFAIHVVCRQKLNGLIPRAYDSLTLGLALWFTAESVWVYYEVIQGIETPFPSLADVFWLAGYVPFIFFFVRIFKNFLGLSRPTLILVLFLSSLGIVLLANILLSIYHEADFSVVDGTIAFLVASAYPVADMFLVVPAVAAFVQLRSGKLTFTPWVMIVAASILFIVADIGFAYFLIVGFDDNIWVWNLLYQVSYFAIASSLFWHRKFFTIDERKLIKEWQERNR